MFRQRNAILRLLSDDDAFTVELVKNQLASHGRDSVPDLLDLLADNDDRVTQHVREVLGRIDADEAIAELGAFCRDFPDTDELDTLETAAFLLARALEPGCNVDGARLTLDRWAGRLAAVFPAGASRRERMAAIGDFFGHELGLRGNTEDYYSIRNSLLPTVMETRMGIPIALAQVYLLVGARAGVLIHGVSFPGHFMIRCDGVLLDPFERGRIVTPSDCAAILERQHLQPSPEQLANAPVRAIFRRMLANLLYIYQSENKEMAATLAGWIHDLER